MSPTHMEREHELEKHAKRLFDDSVAGLDARTRSRLARARARALDELRRPASAWRWSRPSAWAPAGAIAALAVVALVLLRNVPSPQESIEVAELNDLEILLAEEDLDMLEELEFYAWLEEQPEFSSPEAANDGVG